MKQISINHGSTFLIADENARIGGNGDNNQGLFANDTRYLSKHRLFINGEVPDVVNTQIISYRHARWELMTPTDPALDTSKNLQCLVTIDRIISNQRLHEDITVQGFGPETEITIGVELKNDFADIFEVKHRKKQLRNQFNTHWQHPKSLQIRYQREDFYRAFICQIAETDGKVDYVDGALIFTYLHKPDTSWTTCIQYDLHNFPQSMPRIGTCPIHSGKPDEAATIDRRWLRSVTHISSNDSRLNQAAHQATHDFAALRMSNHNFSKDVFIPAAGIPWYAAVFGRDSAIASMQALPIYPKFALGTIQRLAELQANSDNAWLECEPGKIPHELRKGEWTHFGNVPFRPYYATADATALWLMLLGEAWRWLGNNVPLRRYQDVTISCLQWLDKFGDHDGDGLQEWKPKSRHGYIIQCWRDSKDGCPDEFGNQPQLPMGTCELQGYVYAAKRAVAPLFASWGDHKTTKRLLSEAQNLKSLFAQKYWLNNEKNLAFALDGNKRALRTVASNTGHCLWTGIVQPRHANAVVNHLMGEDMVSGWGLRTLSTTNPAYDPHSYHRGSVWPHDTIIAAAGMLRYGYQDAGWKLIDQTLAAAMTFDRCQLPEVFAGVPRQGRTKPIPYRRANIPQAWASGSIFMAIRSLLGLEPDAAAGIIYVDPQLPSWLNHIELQNLQIAGRRVRLEANRSSNGEVDVALNVTEGDSLNLVRSKPIWF